MVDKLALTVTSCPKPYKLQWIKDDGGVVVNQQMSILISLENYKDKFNVT